MKKPRDSRVKNLTRGSYYLLEDQSALHRRLGLVRAKDDPPFYLLLKLTHFYKTGVRFAVLASATKEDYDRSWNLPRNCVSRKHLMKLLENGKLPTGYKSIRYDSILLRSLVEVPLLKLPLYLGGHTSLHMETALREGSRLCTGRKG